jgi:Xaa-Pro dipeptidase
VVVGIRGFPAAEALGFDDEPAACGVPFCHGLGSGLPERLIFRV